jgi:hypothetical protein|tara:strand:- start:172 stop:723 length:552 start_codon:yes stop_codon:yes gene_type:complete
MDRFFHPQSITTVATDIFHTKFLNEEIATALADLLKEDKRWKKGVYDRRYGTHDIPLDEYYPDMYDLIKEQFDNMVVPAMSNVWYFGDRPEAYNIFAVKYSSDTQIALKEHVDQSHISGSIKLNNNYKGGVLEFRRQKYCNEKVEIGDLIIWPSQLTHPHLSTEIVEGEKYAITIWTDVKNNS